MSSSTGASSGTGGNSTEDRATQAAALGAPASRARVSSAGRTGCCGLAAISSVSVTGVLRSRRVPFAAASPRPAARPQALLVLGLVRPEGLGHALGQRDELRRHHDDGG